jgi:hypothetical protein
LVGAKGFLVEEHAGAHTALFVEFWMLSGLREFRDVDAEGAKQACGSRPIRSGAVDVQGTAVHEVQAVLEPVLIALGVAAKIIVVVEQQDARARRGPGSVEVRGGQAADAGADNDQIVFLTGVRRRRSAAAVAQRMGGLEGSRMAAAQAGEQRGIVVRGILGGRGSAACGRRGALRECGAGGQGCRRG